MPYRCKDCRKFFSVRFGTILEESKLPLHKWLMCMYLLATSRKGISSIQISKELGITQKSAWFLCHRIREVWMKDKKEKLDGIVEVDETFIGGKESNKHFSKKLNRGRGSVGKLIIIGAKQRNGKVIVKHIDDTSAYNLQGFIGRHVERNSMCLRMSSNPIKDLSDLSMSLSTIRGNSMSMERFILIPLKASGLY